MRTKKPETEGVDAGTGRTIITPLDARKLQSAESLKPLHERDIGRGSYVALTQRAAARNVKAGLVDAFVRSCSAVKPSMETGSGRKDEVGSGTETGHKTETAMTDETTEAVDSAVAGDDAKGTTAIPPIAEPTDDSNPSGPIAKEPTDPTPVAPVADNTVTNENASPTCSKTPLHQPSLSHQDSPPCENTSARVSSAGSAGAGGKRVGSNLLQESDGNKRVVSDGAGNGKGSSTGGGGSGKSGGQDGEVTGKGKVDGMEKRKLDGAGKGNWKK